MVTLVVEVQLMADKVQCSKHIYTQWGRRRHCFGSAKYVDEGGAPVCAAHRPRGDRPETRREAGQRLAHEQSLRNHEEATKLLASLGVAGWPERNAFARSTETTTHRAVVIPFREVERLVLELQTLRQRVAEQEQV
jgi:hypothetical protein